MTPKPSQCYQVAQYLLRHGSITPLKAQAEFGVMRLAARIEELRNADGYEIDTVYQRSDSGKRYAEYFLA